MSSRAQLAGVLTGAVISLVAGVALRTVMVDTRQLVPDGPPTPADANAAAELVSQAISFPTIGGSAEHSAAFGALGMWLDERFGSFVAAAPQVALELQQDGVKVGHHARLHVWQGRDPSLEPVLFLAHQDVVPVESGTAEDWTYPPFSGAVAPCADWPGDCVWGRGAIDMKLTLVGLASAADRLASAGWQPERTLYFWFSDDEEIGGASTQALNRALEAQGVRFHYILDEGLVVTDGLMAGLSQPTALVGIAEKGYLSVELIASGEMGHSSMPPSSTAVGALARAIARIEDTPFAADLDGSTALMLDHVGPEMSMPHKAVFANTWLFDELVLGQLTSVRTTNALVRTTQAATQLSASPKDNVLPQTARGVVNLRLHPRDTIDSALAHLRSVVAQTGESVEVRPLASAGNTEPSPVSPVDHEGYATIAASVRRQLPEAIVAPGMFIAATDSRHLVGRSDAIYRFTPVRMTPDDVGRVHGTDERVRVDDLAWGFAVLSDLVRNAGGG